MSSKKTVQPRKETEIGTGSPDDRTVRTSAKLEPVAISLKAVLRIARAAQRINTLDELAEYTVEAGKKKIGLRRAVRSLERICCDPRRIAALMLHAADNPDWAWVNFWSVFCPEMSRKEMAKQRHITVNTVKYYLRQTELPADIYDFVPENR